MMKFGKIDPHLFAKKTQRELLHLITGGASGMPVGTMRGRSRRLGATFFVRNGKQCVRRYVKPRQPDSLDQLQHRAWFARSEKQWTPTFLQHGESWAAYAERHREVLGYRDRTMNNGRHLMREVQLTRLQMGLELSEAAPVTPPVQSRLELFQEHAPDDDTFRFQVMHNIPDPTGMSLLVEITPATPRPTRKPHPNSYRPIRGKNAASYLPLQASGAVYEITGARYAVADGERYGMRLRIIDTEHISGEPVARDFIRQIRINPDAPEENEVGRAFLRGVKTSEKAATGKPETNVQPTRHARKAAPGVQRSARAPDAQPAMSASEDPVSTRCKDFVMHMQSEPGRISSPARPRSPDLGGSSCSPDHTITGNEHSSPRFRPRDYCAGVRGHAFASPNLSVEQYVVKATAVMAAKEKPA